LVKTGLGAAEFGQQFPGWLRHPDRPGPAALTEDGYVARSGIWLEIPPAQIAQLAHAQARRIEQSEHRSIPRVRFLSQHSVQVVFAEDALGEAVADSRNTERSTDIKGQISDLVPESKKRLDARQSPILRGCAKTIERISELLEVH
jgi:hypothetical protein